MYPTIELENAVVGEHVVSRGFFFSRIGKPIPVMPRNGGDGDPTPYDPEWVPSQVLAVSEPYELLFVAHSSGFLVARIGALVMEMMWSENSTEDWSFLCSRTTPDIRVGRVRLLLLSPGSWTLAACVGGTVHLFKVASFREEGPLEQRPFLSRTIDGGSSVKDMTWLNEHSYILLTSCGNLYLGRIDGFLKFLKYNVDAVDCSPSFDYIAVARNDELSILSSKLNEESHIALSLQPWTENSDDLSVKVDSLKWVHHDRIVLGCFQLTSDGMERSYLLLVISLTLHVDETSSTQLSLSNVYVQSFPDAFTGIVEDIMPAGSGPHLFLSCLEDYEFAIAANRKNVDQHIVLFDWHEQLALVYIDRDDLLPRIELQENGDDNSIVGLCTDKTTTTGWCYNIATEPPIGIHSELQDIQFRAKSICTLWCVSLDGKLRAFSVV